MRRIRSVWIPRSQPKCNRPSMQILPRKERETTLRMPYKKCCLPTTCKEKPSSSPFYSTFFSKIVLGLHIGSSASYMYSSPILTLLPVKGAIWLFTSRGYPSLGLHSVVQIRGISMKKDRKGFQSGNETGYALQE